MPPLLPLLLYSEPPKRCMNQLAAEGAPKPLAPQELQFVFLVYSRTGEYRWLKCSSLGPGVMIAGQGSTPSLHVLVGTSDYVHRTMLVKDG